jgi:hypothetical protein
VARGEFIQYLDSDDILMPTKFALQVEGLRRQPECGVAYGKTRYYEISALPLDEPWKRTGERIPTMFPAFLQSRWWGTSTPLYRREITDRAGPWLPLWNEEDWEYDCRIAAMAVKLFYCDSFVSDQRVHTDERLSIGGTVNPVKLRDRAEAHRRILQHARRFGISADIPEMRHFARELFLLSRQCGAAGLDSQSAMLFELARRASSQRERNAIDFKAYAVMGKYLGWRRTGLLSIHFDRLRNRLKRLKIQKKLENFA